MFLFLIVPSICFGQSYTGGLSALETVTATMTIESGAILFKDAAGVVQSTMTPGQATIAQISVTTMTATIIRNKNSGPGSPLATKCDEDGESGTFYVSQTPPRLYICADKSGGGVEWRFTNLSP